MQITSAMKMVSAAKLKKAQDAITAMRPYSNKLTDLLQNLSATMDSDTGSQFTQQRPVTKVLVAVITSNRGLCGAFNSNILKAAAGIKEQYTDAQLDFLAIGKKAHDNFSKKDVVISNHSAVFDDLTFGNVALIADELMTRFAAGEYDKIEIVYNKFKNAATQEVMVENFLPLIPAQGIKAEGDYIFEPNKIEIVSQLIPKALKTQLYKAVRDSFASEHGARMTAMHKATDNATELRDQLKLTYNKARQAAITNEILEIVGGAEALNG
jgi:F-type H+-transporting ATPase subunit gamma